MRRATQQALSVPTFRGSMDCTPWVLGGLWPAELHRVTPETELLAEYLKNDLQRIADSANARLRAIAEAGLQEQIRQAEESRIINVARAFAVLRVESTVRQLRPGELGFHAEMLSLAAPTTESAAGGGRHRVPDPQVIDAVVESPSTPAPQDAEEPEPVPAAAAPEEPVADEPVAEEQVAEEPAPEETAPPRFEPPPAEPQPAEPQPPESDQARLLRLLRFVARQEPGLRWAAGRGPGDAILLTTDLAYGWVPPGIDLPDGVELPAPQRRTGTAAQMLADAESTVTYAPGDSFGGFAGPDKPPVSDAPRRLEEIDELPQKLSDATRGREGLPRITHDLALSAAVGETVRDAEVDVLRVHLDTARYQLLARYPELDHALLLNCLLLAATEALTSGDPLAANYHYAWFTALTAAPAGR